MNKLIIVPLDTSRFAEQALPHALLVARRAAARLQLVCVRPSMPLEVQPDFDESLYLGRLAAQLEPQLPGAVSATVLSDEYGPFNYIPSANAIASAISRHALAQDASLIVLATHGRGGVRRAWLGSVADSLVRLAARPILLIRPTDEAFGSAASADRGIRHIAVALDGSPAAEQVIPFALELGNMFDARYTLVRVISPRPVPPEAWVTTMPLPPLDGQASRDYLERLAASLRLQGITVTTAVLEELSPAPAIVDYASSQAIDVIAVSTHGAGGVRRWLLGSVADKIVRSSNVPVLACNIRHIAQAEHDWERETASAHLLPQS